MMFKLPANTKIPPHSHPDLRSCFVLSGTFYFAYGETRDEALLKARAGARRVQRTRRFHPHPGAHAYTCRDVECDV